MAYTGASIANIIGQGAHNFNHLTAQNQALQSQMKAAEEVSDDPSHWAAGEQLRMFVWFMKMHHEEDIKGFKALRDIERSVERAEREELERKQMEMYQQLQAAQNSTVTLGNYANATSITGTWGNTTTTATPYATVSDAQDEPEKQSLWRRLWYKI